MADGEHSGTPGAQIYVRGDTEIRGESRQNIEMVLILCLAFNEPILWVNSF